MDIHFTATGTPGNAQQDLSKQLKTYRTDHPDAWQATLAGLRDDVAKELQKRGGENVQVDLHVTFGVTSLTPGDAAKTFGAPPRGSTGGNLGGASLEEAEQEVK